MNYVTPEKKMSVLKSLAVIGLFGVVLLIAWLSVQIVNVFPSAVSSLASLADSVYTYQPKNNSSVEISPVNGPVISGEETIITWKKPLKTGTYAFSYECKEGLSVEIKSTENAFTGAECEKSYVLGGVDNAQLVINSEKKLEQDFVYTISYFKTNSPSSTAQTTQTFTVKNPIFSDTEETKPEVTVNEIVVTPKEDEVVAEVTEPDAPAKPKPVTPTKPEVFTYTYLPVSNANGFTDLEVSYIGIGQTNLGTFTNSGLLSFGKAGAVQFAVKNIGTKTSEEFTIEALLPGGVTYTSGAQLALKPNERAAFTIEFPAVQSTELQTFKASASTKSDSNKQNDNISWSTIVIR
jgi:hypothetical protein